MIVGYLRFGVDCGNEKHSAPHSPKSVRGGIDANELRLLYEDEFAGCHITGSFQTIEVDTIGNLTTRLIEPIPE
jgi:hypothetical protein